MERRRGAMRRCRQTSILCEPPVRAKHEMVDCVNEGGHPDTLLVIEVSCSEGVHSNRKDEVFLRMGDENGRLSLLQRQELL